jgi:cytochrome c peroxidase
MVPNQTMGLDPSIYLDIPSLTNAAWKGPFGWFSQDPRLDLVPINDFGPHFFNTNKDTMLRRLQQHPEYPALFKAAWLQDVLTKDKVETAISYAIAQFIRTIVTADSKYDRYLRKEENLSQQELRGMSLFFSEKGDCFHCHGSILFTDNQLHNIGLDKEPAGLNRGRYLVSGMPEDMGKMKTPSLRNVALTAPYMHDGRFSTIAQVIEHYNSGVQHSPAVDPLMTKENAQIVLNLTTGDKEDLAAFLLTLTDSTLLIDPRYSNPH